MSIPNTNEEDRTDGKMSTPNITNEENLGDGNNPNAGIAEEDLMDECPICMEEITTDQPSFKCTCPYLYHEECIIEWLKDKPARERKCMICHKLTPWGLRKARNNGRSLITGASKRLVREHGPLRDDLRGARTAEICAAYLRTLHPTVWYPDLNAQQKLELLEFHRGRSLFDRMGWRYRDRGSDLLKEIPNEFRAPFEHLIEDTTISHVEFRDGNSVVVTRLITEELLSRIRVLSTFGVRRISVRDYENFYELMKHAWFLLSWIVDTYDILDSTVTWPSPDCHVEVSPATLSPFRRVEDDLDWDFRVALHDAINEVRDTSGMRWHPRFLP